MVIHITPTDKKSRLRWKYIVDIIPRVNEQDKSANHQIASAAGIVMAAFVLSNITGLLRQILISKTFGTGADIDAFYAASRLPDILFNLVAGGALASAFVPAFTQLITTKKPQKAWKLASNIANLVFLLLSAASLLSAVFAPFIVLRIISPGFSDPIQIATTIKLLRIMLISTSIFGISGLLMGILNSYQKFILPALAPTMYWLGMIFGVLVLAGPMGIEGLAWGVVLGASLHLAIQLPGLKKLGFHYDLELGLADQNTLHVARLMAPRLVGQAAVQINLTVNTILASGQPAGSLTAINYAWAVMTMPQVVIAQAIAIAALPTFSAQVARGEIQQMRSSLASTLRGVIWLAVPAAVGLIILRQPITRMLFERGAFDERSTQMVSWALVWYAAGLISHSIVEIVSRAFYALHDTKTPVIIGVGSMGLNLVFSLGFAAQFTRMGLPPHGGLALANSVATTIEMVVLLGFMHKRLNGLNGRLILTGTTKSGLASIVMLAALVGWLIYSQNAGVWVVGLGGVFIGTITYALTSYLIRQDEIITAASFVVSRFRSD